MLSKGLRPATIIENKHVVSLIADMYGLEYYTSKHKGDWRILERGNSFVATTTVSTGLNLPKYDLWVIYGITNIYTLIQTLGRPRIGDVKVLLINCVDIDETAEVWKSNIEATI